MKKIAFLILLSFTLTGCPDPPEELEMLDDCTLEDASLGAWLNNAMGPATDFIIVRTNEESFSQTHSLKISKTAPDPESYAYCSQSIIENLPAYKKLTLSAMIKCANLTGRGASIVIRVDDNNSVVQIVSTENTTTINGTTDWIQYSVSLDALKPEADKIIVYLMYLNNTNGTVYFDNIHLIAE